MNNQVEVKDRIVAQEWVLPEPVRIYLPPDEKAIVMDLFAKKPWKTPKSMGFIGTLSSPMIIDGLKYEPLILEECNIPPTAWERINTILKSGVSSQEFYIGHELVEPGKKVKIPWKRIGKYVAIATGAIMAIGAILAVAATVLMLLAAAVTVLMPLMFFVALAAGVDPKIVYRTSEGEWLAVFVYFT